MEIIDDAKLTLYKKLSEMICENLENKLAVLNKKCAEILVVFEKERERFLSDESIDRVGVSSAKIKETQFLLNKLFAIQDRIQKMLSRNRQRIEYLTEKLKQIGIYNYDVDKKTLASELAEAKKELSEESLNLNRKDGDRITYKFVEGLVLAFRDDRLDLSLEFNQNVILKSTQDDIHLIIKYFPYAVATIPDEILEVPTIKNNLIKEIVIFAAQKYKDQSFADTNRELGGILEKAGEIDMIEDFAEAVRNNFNVSAKQAFARNHPELAEQIEEKLRCNESSRHLPSDKKRYTEQKESETSQEEQTSQEVSGQTEPEAEQKTDEAMMKELDDLLNDLFDSDDSDDDKKED